MNKKFRLVMLGLILAIFALTMSAFGAPKVMKIGHEMNPEHPEHQALLKFEELFEERTNGEFDVQIFPSNQLGSFFVQIQNMKQNIQQGHLNGLGWPGHFVPEFFLFNTAFAFKNFDEYAKAINSPVGLEIRQKLIDEHGIRLVSVSEWRRGVRNLLCKHPINSVDEVVGLKIRVPETPSYIESWKALGASPTPVAFGEVYLALQQGVVDAMECPLDLIYSQKFYEPVKYISLTGHLPELVALGVTEKFYQSLTDEQKVILEECVTEAGIYNREIVANSEADIKAKMAEAGVKYIEVDQNAFWEKGKNAAYNLEELEIWPKGFYDRIAESIK